MQDKKSLEVLDHAAGVADDLIARALVIAPGVPSASDRCTGRGGVPGQAAGGGGWLTLVGRMSLAQASPGVIAYKAYAFGVCRHSAAWA